MNFLDKFQQDQEAAKSDLTSILNQKAFDLLDSFANEAEIEVVTFSDEDENTNEAVEDLNEGLGSLAGLSKHLIKTVTSRGGAGEHSEVETHSIKNKSAHRAVINQALDDGHVPVVYVNGKIHSAGHSTGSSNGRPEFNIHDSDKQKEEQETIRPKPRRVGGKVYYPASYTVPNKRYSKGDALSKLTPGHEASFYKDNKVEVKVVKADKVRQKLKTDRHANRPATQNNYVKSKPGDKNVDQYLDGKTKTSTTSAGDNLKAIKDHAALRLATKKLGGDSPSASKKAMDLHAELGKHLAAGNHKDAINTANALADHVRQQGLTTHADKIKDYADALKDLKDTWRDKGYTHKKLAAIRGETNESEVIESLESMLTEMLNINEGKITDGLKKVAKFTADAADAVIQGGIHGLTHGPSNPAPISDYSHVRPLGKLYDKITKKRNEEVELAQEAVVPGSVKKDKHGNILSFKSIGDKNPEKQYDNSVKKDLEARKKYNSDFGKK